MTDGSALVAFLATNGGMRSEKRETILVILDLLRSDLPAEDGVALGTIRAHFPPVNVGVAVLAIFANVSEDGFEVALGALHLFVHAAERVFSFAVIEFRDLANGAPARGSVAIFARNIQVAVRAVGAVFLRKSVMRQRVVRHSRPRKSENEPAQGLDERVVGSHPGSSTTPSTGGSSFRSVCPIFPTARRLKQLYARPVPGQRIAP